MGKSSGQTPTVAVLMGGIVLEISGYQANVEQTPNAIIMMRSLYSGVPVVLYGLVIVLLANFTLNQREHAEIRAEIDRRNGGSPRDL